MQMIKKVKIFLKIILDISVYKKYFVFMAKRKKKMGRPKKKVRDVRSKPVTLRVTPSNHKQLKQDAKHAGMSISAYLLECWQITKDKKSAPAKA
jgi:predicted HicB family RNase H-like nuclease